MAVTETFYVVDFPYDDMLKYMIRKLDESGGDSAIDDKIPTEEEFLRALAELDEKGGGQDG